MSLATLLPLVAMTATSPLPPGPLRWQDGTVHGLWHTVFTGYGVVHGDDTQVTLEPLAATGPGTTHAALVVTRQHYGDLSLSVSVETERQLRDGAPNTWEVGWVLWRYRDPQHFYAVALKPNGWEVSKQDPAYAGGQRFLASGSSPVFAVGTRHDVRIRQTGDSFTVSADGRELTSFTDVEDPYPTGAVGLYCEDARVHFRDVRVLAEPRPGTAPATDRQESSR